MTPDSRSTSASTVGLPRESRISLATTSTIELMSVPFFSGYLCSSGALRRDAVFRESPALHYTIQLEKRLEEFLHHAQRPRIGPVRKRLGGIRMRFHEDPRDTGRN